MKQSEVEEEFHRIFEFEFSNSKWKKTLVHMEFIFAKLCEENFPSYPTEESTEKDIDFYQLSIDRTLKKEEGGVEEVESEMVGEGVDGEVPTDNEQFDLNSYQLPIFEPLKVERGMESGFTDSVQRWQEAGSVRIAACRR